MADLDGEERPEPRDPLGHLSDEELVDRLRGGLHGRSWTVAELISLEHRGYDILDDEPELRTAIQESVELAWSRVQDSIQPLLDNVTEQLRVASDSPAFRKIREDIAEEFSVLKQSPALKSLTDDMRASITSASPPSALPAGPPSSAPPIRAMDQESLEDERIDSPNVLVAATQNHTSILLRIDEKLGEIGSHASDTADATAVHVEHAVAASNEAKDDARRSRGISWLSFAASAVAITIAVIALVTR